MPVCVGPFLNRLTISSPNPSKYEQTRHDHGPKLVFFTHNHPYIKNLIITLISSSSNARHPIKANCHVVTCSVCYLISTRGPIETCKESQYKIVPSAPSSSFSFVFPWKILDNYLVSFLPLFADHNYSYNYLCVYIYTYKFRVLGIDFCIDGAKCGFYVSGRATSGTT